jgi:hypothetical protein
MILFLRGVYGSYPNLIHELEENILSSGVSMRVVEESIYVSHPLRVITKVYDKYFMRNSSRASLSLTVVEDGRTTHVIAIGAGGSQGVIFNFSWGAETELVDVVRKTLETKGF